MTFVLGTMNVEWAHSPCFEGLVLCRRVPCVEFMSLMILASWRLSKYEMGSQRRVLLAQPWEYIGMGTLDSVLAWRRVVGQ